MRAATDARPDDDDDDDETEVLSDSLSRAPFLAVLSFLDPRFIKGPLPTEPETCYLIRTLPGAS